MKKYLPIILFIPILIFFVFTNYYIDPANLFHDANEEIAKEILNGNKVYITSGNGDERAVKEKLIQNMPKEVECIAVGPSLVMGVRAEDVGTDEYYNLGVSAADYYDILGQLGLMEANGIEYKRLVFCVDSYFFLEEIYDNPDRARNGQLMPYAKYMLSILDGNNEEIPSEKESNIDITEIEQLFSVTYFQSAKTQVELSGSYLREERWGIVGEDFSEMDYPHYWEDGSWVYAKSYQARTVDDVIATSKEYDLSSVFVKGSHMSSESKVTFEKLLEYLLKKGVEVDLYLCPLTPTLWDRLEMEMESYPIVTELETYAYDIADKYSLNIIGSYNPYNVGILDEDFYDARHVRHEKLSTYFQFKH